MDIIDINKGGGHCIHDLVHSNIYPRERSRVVGMRMTTLFVFILPTYFSITLTYHAVQSQTSSLMSMVKRKSKFQILICRVAPTFLDLSTNPSRRQCILRLSRNSEVNSVGAIEKISLPRNIPRLPLPAMNLMLCFPIRVIYSSSTGIAH